MDFRLVNDYLPKVSLQGQPNQYGLGTLMHEILHEQIIGGGFNHGQMDAAIQQIHAQSDGGVFESSALGKLCF